MGDLIRFHRTEVDQWAREEAQRRRSGRIRPPAQAGDVTSTEAAAGSKLRSTLTAVGLTKKEKAYAGI
jgi:hypothetical protein